MNLVDFLLARIAEDAAASSRGIQEGPHLWPPLLDDYQLSDPVVLSEHNAARDFIAQYPPSRMHSDATTRRMIVNLLADDWAGWTGPDAAQVRADMTPAQAARFNVAEQVLCALAFPYHEHPDFDSEWTRPAGRL